MAGIPGVASACGERCPVSRVGPARRALHLSRRFFGALSRKQPSTSDVAWATGFLLPAEVVLWTRLCQADQRHSIAVARRFVTHMGESSRDDVAAALLHDIGKLASGLGVAGRVCATIVGPRTARLRRYHDHERLGAAMLRDVGSSERTSSLVDATCTDLAMLTALRLADDV